LNANRTIMPNQQADILILYSNPSDTDRLRLDKEHRAVEQVISDLRLDPRRIQRLHAVSVMDVISALQKNSFDIVQFSGHGSSKGIYLEDELYDEGTEVSAKRMASILKSAHPKLKAAIFVSCFSASSVSELVDAAPYLITVSGPADDDASIEFMRRFYHAYFRSNSVEVAFETAVRLVGAILERQGVHPVLSRRAKVKGVDRFLIQAFPVSGDSLLVDLTEAEKDFKKITLNQDEFLSLLTRKVRGHQWVFDIPRERVILPIGSYFGIFSWQDSNDVVYCSRILQVKDDTDESTCRVWVKFAMRYNDLFSERYRSVTNPSDPLNSRLIELALEAFSTFYKDFFEDEKASEVLRSCLGKHYKTSSAIIESNLSLSLSKYHQGDAKAVILYLESTLSAIHDLVDLLTEQLCE